MASVISALDEAGSWSLEDLVLRVNRYLPQILPVDSGAREEVTPRLVRYYTTARLIDEPEKVGRGARYQMRHLLQILVIRKMLAEGLKMSGIGSLARRHSDDELHRMLLQPVALRPTATNPALEYLDQIALGQPGKASSLPSLPPLFDAPSGRVGRPLERNDAVKVQYRMEVEPHFQLEVGEDFAFPNSPAEMQNLLGRVERALLALKQARRSGKR